MRRVATSQLTHTGHIFVTDVTEHDGEKRSVISSQSLGDRSIHIHGKQTISGALFLMIIHCSHQQGIFLKNKKNLPHDAWTNIFLFIFNIQHFEQVDHIACYAAALKIPALFKRIPMTALFVVDAVMRGQEDMVMNILQANSEYLLKKAIVKNAVGVEYETTPLQAALMANDIQMVEKMLGYFTRLSKDLDDNAINGLTEMYRQVTEIYKKSLWRYCEIQKDKITALKVFQQCSDQIINHIIDRAQHQYNVYLEALQSDDIRQILNAHNLAQENNAFDFTLYVDAILNAPQTELEDVMAHINAKTAEETKTAIAQTGIAARQTNECRKKSFNELTLVQTLNRLREKFVLHVQNEIIFNSHHILTGMKHNEQIWAEVNANRIADPNCHKRIVIFAQLVGWAQRNAAEPARQDIRQGIWFMIEKNELRARPSGLRSDDSDLTLVDSAAAAGLGYQFALPQLNWNAPSANLFLKLMSRKNNKLSELIIQPARIQPHNNQQIYSCVVQ